jgi:diguanylate cyclase (GGDEF)-like protein
MEAEFERSRRHGYPLTAALVEIDRLESLHDLYGIESEQRIVNAVLAMLRSTTRASDVLGTLQDGRMLVLFPHTPPAAVATIARRLLAACRELEFRGEGRSLRATISIGLAQREPQGDLEGLCAAAERALEATLEAGGDRFLEHERLPEAPVAAPPVEEPAPLLPPVLVPARPPPVRAAPGLPPAEELAGASLEEKVQHLFGLIGTDGDSDALEREVLEILRRTLAEARGTRASQAEVEAEVRALEARVAKLKELLDASEEELARLVQEKSVDPGIASIYRTVQGLDPLARDFARKRELLGLIYQANLELLRQLKGDAG